MGRHLYRPEAHGEEDGPDRPCDKEASVESNKTSNRMERADRKRALDGGASAAASPAAPPRKHAKVGGVGGGLRDARTEANGGGEDEAEAAGSGGALGVFQRSQLAAKVGELSREVAWARGKITEMEAVVAVLDAAPTQAGYFLAAANEDLSVCLRDVGGGGGETVGVASSVLDTEVSVTALGAEVEELKRLSKAVVEAVRCNGLKHRQQGGHEASAAASGDAAVGSEGGEDRAESMRDMQQRMRSAMDQLERYEVRRRESRLATDNLRDEMDDIRMLLDIRRRKIVALELAIREGRDHPAAAIQAAAANAVGRDVGMVGVGRENGGATGPGQGSDSDGGVDREGSGGGSGGGGSGDGGGGSGDGRSSPEQKTGDDGGGAAAVDGRGEGSVGGGDDLADRMALLQKLAAQRLEELQAMLKEKETLSLHVLSLQKEADARKVGILPESVVRSGAVYKSLEIRCQQVSERVVEQEEAAKVLADQREKADCDAEALVEQAEGRAEKMAEDSRRRLEDLRRISDGARAEKDKSAMTYEVRKMEGKAAADLAEACERRASMCTGMGDMLKKSNAELTREVEQLRNRVREAELRVVGGAGAEDLPNAKALASRLEADLAAEGEKCAGFIEEIESLSVMFGDLEAENARLVKLLAAKDSVLSKVMGEKLRGKQQLATVKEEAKSLTQAHEGDQDKIRNLGKQVSASKRAVTESKASASKQSAEVRLLQEQLAKLRESLIAAKNAKATAIVNLERVQKELGLMSERCKDLTVKKATSLFDDRRLSEENAELKAKLTSAERRLKEAESAAASSQAPGNDGGKESLRDEIIQELMKKLHCSVCPNQPKEVALVRCGHMLSRQCVEQLVAQRSRKCPLCGLPFSASDVLSVFLD